MGRNKVSTEHYDGEADIPSPLSHASQAAPPTLAQIPSQDLIGVTVVLLTASYKEQEFVRIGYYVHTEYETEELRALEESQRPNPPLVDKLSRNVLADKPRVTRFNIKW